MNHLLIITPCVPNGLPTQGAVIAQRLRQEGVSVAVLSAARTRIGRLLDVVTRGPWLAWRHRSVLVDVFAERAFVYESIAILYSSILARRVVVMLHSGVLPEFVGRWPRWTRFVLSRAHVVLTPHAFLRERLATSGIRVDATIPNFIDLEKYPYRQRVAIRPRFLFLRGLHPLYNPEMALRAFAVIQSRCPDASLTMAGPEGPDSDRCRSLARELGVRNVIFRGLVPKAEIPTLADEHDIHLHTNRFDNMPVTVLEMWASGLPIVGTAVGGMCHLVRHGVDGLLVPSEDYSAMADACLELLSNSTLTSQLSRNGRARADALSWQRVKSAWSHVLFDFDARASIVERTDSFSDAFGSSSSAAARDTSGRVVHSCAE